MNTDELIKESKAKFDHNLAKHYLKEKYQSKLIFADQGGLWKATPDFLSFLSSLTLIEKICMKIQLRLIKNH